MSPPFPLAAERRVFIGQLSRMWDEAFVRSLLDRFGTVEDVRFLSDSHDDTGTEAVLSESSSPQYVHVR